MEQLNYGLENETIMTTDRPRMKRRKINGLGVLLILVFYVSYANAAPVLGTQLQETIPSKQDSDLR